jgi:hypothetical protein
LIGNFLVFSSIGTIWHLGQVFFSQKRTQRFSSKPVFIFYISQSHDRTERLGCPVRALKYILKELVLSEVIYSIFITSVNPFKPAARSTLAGWLVNVISNSGALQDSGTPRAHSVRAYATSWAFAKGLPIGNIINTVSWRTENTFIKCFLKDVEPRTQQTRFAYCVLTHSK